MYRTASSLGGGGNYYARSSYKQGRVTGAIQTFRIYKTTINDNQLNAKPLLPKIKFFETITQSGSNNTVVSVHRLSFQLNQPNKQTDRQAAAEARPEGKVTC